VGALGAARLAEALECKGKGVIGSKRFIACDGVAACSLLCCAENQVSDSEVAMALIKQK